LPGEGERERGYWRDVGTLDAYFDATMDLRDVSPLLNLYNHAWPIRSAVLQYPPVKFVFDQEGRRGMAVNSIVGDGAIISGGRVRDSVVFNNVFVHSYCNIEQSILMQGGNIGRGVRLHRRGPRGRRRPLPHQSGRRRRHSEGRHRTARRPAPVQQLAAAARQHPAPPSRAGLGQDHAGEHRERDDVTPWADKLDDLMIS
jgi:hypothetical protein